MLFVFRYFVKRRGSIFKYDFRKFPGLKPFKVPGPLLVIINAHGKTGRAIIVFPEIGETFTGIDQVPIIAKMILSRFRTALIGNGFSRTVNATSLAVITKCSNSCIDRVVNGQWYGGSNAPHAEQRPEFRMNDRTMPPQLAEACFQADGNV